jgi:hypothetical protein
VLKKEHAMKSEELLPFIAGSVIVALMVVTFITFVRKEESFYDILVRCLR